MVLAFKHEAGVQTLFYNFRRKILIFSSANISPTDSIHVYYYYSLIFAKD